MRIMGEMLYLEPLTGSFANYANEYICPWAGYITASYQGVELIGITAGEDQDSKNTLIKATKNIIWRILIFYISAIFVIVIIYPWNKISALGSPFVLTFTKIGISTVAGIVNFVGRVNKFIFNWYVY